MNAPVDKNTAACDGFIGECAAETGDGAVGAEGNVNMINLAKLAGLNKIAKAVYRGVKAVYDADIENLTGFVLNRLHFHGFVKGSRRGLFAKDVFTCTKEIYGDGLMHFIGGTNRNGFDFRVIKDFVIILNSNTATVFFNGGVGLGFDDIAEIFDLYLIIFHICGDMGIVCDRTATDNCDFHFRHKNLRIFIFSQF